MHQESPRMESPEPIEMRPFRQQLQALLVDKHPQAYSSLADVDRDTILTNILNKYDSPAVSLEDKAAILEDVANSSFEELKAKYFDMTEADAGKEEVAEEEEMVA